MIDNPTSSRRSRWTVPVLTAAGVLGALVLGILLARTHQDPPGRPRVAPLPPASPGVVSTGYLGSRWRLTTVSDRDSTTTIPVSVDAWLEMTPNGELLASDDVNTVSGRFLVTGTGFDVFDAATTLVAYGGTDPAQVAAVTGIDAVTSQVSPSTASSPAEARPVHVTVLSADREHLTVQAGGVRLAFVRSGPAHTPNQPLLTSSAPGR